MVAEFFIKTHEIDINGVHLYEFKMFEFKEVSLWNGCQFFPPIKPEEFELVVKRSILG